MPTEKQPVVARKVRVPASSANLGPGFDTLALALQRYTSLTIRPALSFSISATGFGSHLTQGADHFAAKIIRKIVGHDLFSLEVDSDIPMTRGLGSSAALAVGAAALAGHPDPFSFAAALEGHADNAAAAVLGGFVTGAMIDGVGVAAKLALDPLLRFVVVVPERQLKTSAARKVLPVSVQINDVVFQLGRMGQLIAGMADHTKLQSAATQDRLHQNQRAALFPAAPKLLHAMNEAGALASCWSGAGPTLLAMCTDETVNEVVAAAQTVLGSSNVPGTVEQIDPDLYGLITEEL
jgi:homoserine kinase